MDPKFGVQLNMLQYDKRGRDMWRDATLEVCCRKNHHVYCMVVALS